MAQRRKSAEHALLAFWPVSLAEISVPMGIKEDPHSPAAVVLAGSGLALAALVAVEGASCCSLACLLA